MKEPVQKRARLSDDNTSSFSDVDAPLFKSPSTKSSTLNFWQRPEYLATLTTEQRLGRDLRARFPLREHALLGRRDRSKERTGRASSAASSDSRIGEFKITRQAGRGPKDDLIADVLRRWWFVFPDIAERQRKFDAEVDTARERAAEKLRKIDKTSGKRASASAFAARVNAEAQKNLINRASVAAEVKKLGLRHVTYDEFWATYGEETFEPKKKKSKVSIGSDKRTTVYELMQFPGFFRSSEGTLFDARPQPRISHEFLKEKYTNAELKKLVEVGIGRQIVELKKKNATVKWNAPEDENLLKMLEKESKKSS